MQAPADTLPVRSGQQAAPHTPDLCIGKARRSIFASIMLALRASRRLQAHRILRQNRHLIAYPEEFIPRELESVDLNAEMKPILHGCGKKG
jgi:hypothetical protein